MRYNYKPRGVCSRQFELDVEDGVIRDVNIEGGCDGNLQGISRLAVGRPVNEVIELLNGIHCGNKSTSCPDQLAQALREYIEHSEQAS